MAENAVSQSFDHSIFDQLLKKYVNNGFVSYSSLLQQRAQLDEYLKLISVQNPELLGRPAQLAFYINAYNAFTITLILNNLGKIKSIRDIGKPWDQKTWNIGGKKYSLNEIEHEILRKRFSEPRIHFAIVCASIGCPDLQPYAFTADKLEEQLAQVTKDFFSSPKHLQISGKTVRVSQIFNWFGDDFKQKGASLLDFIMKNADSNTATSLSEIVKKAEVKFLDYDWNLNGK